MRLFLIRHGDPDYINNKITDYGHRQAEALAQKLYNSKTKISAIYSSPYGRAIETAEHTARLYGMPVGILDFIFEITAAVPQMTEEEKTQYSPWYFPNNMLENGINLASIDPNSCDIYAKTRIKDNDLRVTQGFDNWLAELGYQRNGYIYKCTKINHDRIYVFAHGGSISCILGHLIGTNMIHACEYFRLTCTGVSEIEFHADDVGGNVFPHIRTFNDYSHLSNIKKD